MPRRSTRRTLAGLTLALVLAGSGAARAQSGPDAAGAQALFEQGKALMAAGKYDEACPKLEDSQRLDPGGGTLLALALCHEAEGRTATAWADFNLALSAARKDGRADREKAAQEHIHALEPVLSRLTITVARPAADQRVTRDGTIVGAAEWGTPLPLDPGAHRVEAVAPGKTTWSTSVSVPPQASAEVQVPPLEDAVAAVPVPVPLPPPVVHPPPPPPAESRGGTQVVLGLVVGGAGVAGLAAGAVLGLESLSHWSAAKNACPSLICPTTAASTTGQQASNDAKTTADMSTVAFIAGGVLLATGAVIFFTAPGRSGTREGAAAWQLAPLVVRDGGGLALGGAL